MAAQSEFQYAYRAQKSLGLVNGEADYSPVASFDVDVGTARTYSYSPDGRYIAYAFLSEVRIYQSHPTELLHTLPLPNIIEIHFSPQGTYFSTWERPVTSTAKPSPSDGSAPPVPAQPTQHKNLRIHLTATGAELVSLTQKSLGETFAWDVQYTEDEGYAIRLVGGEVQVWRPSLWVSSNEVGPASGASGLVDKIRVEGATAASLSSGPNPSLAIFVAEKKGLPASGSIYSLLPPAAYPTDGSTPKIIAPTPTTQKTFFKADRSTFKWNCSGTQLLLLTQTDVDNSNKSYYGETLLYLLSTTGPSAGEAQKVKLDKEGPIHDFTWSPNGKEFGVVYGYMPAKTSIFTSRLQSLAEFPPSPYNFISFNPQGRLIALAGFGNLAGRIDIIDRRTLKKVSWLKAENTTYCEWSADGLRLLTATLSPRLRVDNGIRVWWVAPSTPPAEGGVGEGSLVHVQEIEELYQASWRPSPSPFSITPTTPAPGRTPRTPITPAPTTNFPSVLPPAPTASPSAIAYLLSRPSTKSTLPGSAPGTPKAAGAYRPPGARGLATPAIFKREDEGGVPSTPIGGGSGSNTPTAMTPVTGRNHMVPGSFGYAQGQGGPQGPGRDGGGPRDRDRRHVPGSGPQQQQQQQGQGEEKKRKRSKGGKKGLEGEGGDAEQQQQNGVGAHGRKDSQGGGGGGGPGKRGGKKERIDRERPSLDVNRDDVPLVETAALTIDPISAAEPTTPLDSGGLDAIGKKMRNLNKKLKAIDELKEKAKRGERLEATQLKKMEGEAEIRKELAALSVADN